MATAPRRSLKDGAGKKSAAKRSIQRNSKGRLPQATGGAVRAVSTREAKNQLSAIIRDAREEGEIMITSDNEPSAVIMSVSRYRRLTQRQTSLVEFFRESPLGGAELRIERDKDNGRDVDLS